MEGQAPHSMALERREPLGGIGAFSFVHNDYMYVCYNRYCDPVRERQHKLFRNREYSEDQLLPVQRFDFSSAQWSGVSPVCVDHEPGGKGYWPKLSVDCGMCCAVLGNCAYTFGGLCKYGYAVHELNLETMVWRRLQPKNREDGPMHKKDAGMVACGGEALCVFGGFGRDTSRHQPGATYHSDDGYYSKRDLYHTNELHLFHVKTCKYIGFVEDNYKA